MLRIEELRAAYDGEEILHGVSLTARPGETLAIIGESGAGKTTLGLSLLRLTEAKLSGAAWWKERDLLALAGEELRDLRGRKVAMAHQNGGEVLHPLVTAIQQVAEAVTVHFPVTPATARQ